MPPKRIEKAATIVFCPMPNCSNANERVKIKINTSTPMLKNFADRIWAFTAPISTLRARNLLMMNPMMKMKRATMRLGRK